MSYGTHFLSETHMGDLIPRGGRVIVPAIRRDETRGPQGTATAQSTRTCGGGELVAPAAGMSKRVGLRFAPSDPFYPYEPVPCSPAVPSTFVRLFRAAWT